MIIIIITYYVHEMEEKQVKEEDGFYFQITSSGLLGFHRRMVDRSASYDRLRKIEVHTIYSISTRAQAIWSSTVIVPPGSVSHMRTGIERTKTSDLSAFFFPLGPPPPPLAAKKRKKKKDTSIRAHLVCCS